MAAILDLLRQLHCIVIITATAAATTTVVVSVDIATGKITSLLRWQLNSERSRKRNSGESKE